MYIYIYPDNPFKETLYPFEKLHQGQKTALAVAAGAAATLASTVPGCHWGLGFKGLGFGDFGSRL